MKNELVFTKKEEVFASSTKIAERLGVPHRDLLRTIEKLIEDDYGVQCAGQHIVNIPKSGATYIKTKFKNAKGREYPMYNMNEEGFMMIVMQLGRYKKAREVQHAFVRAFASMKKTLLDHQNSSWVDRRETGKITRKSETDTIQEFVEYAKEQGSKNAEMYYGNITKMTNKALEILIQFEKELLPKGKSIRDVASKTELMFIAMADYRAEQAIIEGMRRGYPYKEVYRYAKEEVLKLVESMDFKPRLED